MYYTNIYPTSAGGCKRRHDPQHRFFFFLDSSACPLDPFGFSLDADVLMGGGYRFSAVLSKSNTDPMSSMDSKSSSGFVGHEVADHRVPCCKAGWI